MRFLGVCCKLRILSLRIWDSSLWISSFLVKLSQLSFHLVIAFLSWMMQIMLLLSGTSLSYY